MAKALGGHDLEVYRYRPVFTKETKEIIARIRASPPSHNLCKCPGNVHVWYPSKKMSSIIKAESRRVEFP